ncbi:uncharacterized protein LOC121698383 [Alosa sapidissima]|uniref:uncharacterized protein LOC121698383 n=1 Tax=Alosa sapidissima TaxID=34773 RepID=UPI001C0A02E1|nr:uncharacterized protein LOC121698383 [Alosa sapidissima]
MFDWLGATFNLFNFIGPEPPPPSITDIGFQALQNHMDTLLLFIYVILHVGTSYLPVFLEDDTLDVMILDLLKKCAEGNIMDSSERTLRLALCHLSRIERLLETDYSPEDSSDPTCAGSCHEQTTSCWGGDTKGMEDGYLSNTATNQDSGELKISFWTQSPLDHVPCSEPMGDREPLATSTTGNNTNQEQLQGPQTVCLPCCESRIKNTIAHKRWRWAFLMVQIVRMLAASIPARLKPPTPASPQAKTKTVKTAFRSPVFFTQKLRNFSESKAANSIPSPILMFSQAIRPPFVTERVWQKLEAHVRRKTSQRLWGFPNPVIKYVGDHALQLHAGDGRPVWNTVKPWNPEAQIGLCLKRTGEVSEKLQNLSEPARKEQAGALVCSKQLAEHPEILRAASPSVALDGVLEEVTSLKRRLENKLRRKFLEVKLCTIPGKVLQSYHTAPYIAKNQKVLPAFTQQRSPCKLKRRDKETLPFMSQEDLNRIELNLQLKRSEHQQGKSTYYTLSLENIRGIN